MAKSEKKKFNYFNLITFLITLGVVLYYAFSDPEVKNLGSLLLQFNPVYLLATSLCIIVYYMCDGAALHVGCSLFSKELTMLRALKVSIIGAYYWAITPLAAGAQPMQVVYMKKWNVPTSLSSSVTVIMLFFWHLSMSIFSTTALFLYSSTLRSHSGIFVACIIGICISLFLTLAGFLILFNVNFRPVILFFVKLLKKIKVVKNAEKVDIAVDNWIGDFREAFTIFKKSPKKIIEMLLLMILKVISYSSVIYFIYRGFGLNELSFIHIVLLKIVIASGVSFVPTPGAAGASEGVFYTVFSSIFTNGTTFAAMLLWRGFTYYMFIFLGVIVNLFDGIDSLRFRIKNKKAV